MTCAQIFYGGDTEATATAGALIATGAWPTSVVMWPDSGYALVAQTGRDSLGFLNLTTLALEDAIHVGNEPAGIVVAGDIAYVSISGANEVAKVDLTTRTVVGTLMTGHDPRSMVLSPSGDRLYVASLMSFNEHRLGLLEGTTEPELQRDITIVDTATFTHVGWVPEVGTMTRGLWISPDGKRLIAAVTHSNNDGSSIDADSMPHSHGLAVMDDIDTLGPETPVTQIDLDYREISAGPAPSPFTMAVTPDGSKLVVTLSAGKAFLVLHPETLEEIMRVPTGNDPRGLIFAKGKVWTTAWLDNQLQGITLPEPGVLGALDQVSVEVGADPTPMAIKQGQRIFNDAGFSKHGDFSCNNCHIDGLTDGLVWDLLVDGDVNTLAFRNVAGTDPFLWGGQLPTLFDFSREVLRLVGADASGGEMESLTLYMQSITAPPNPYTRPGGRLTDLGELGKSVFDAPAGDGGGGCAACHSGPLFTNRTMVKGKTNGKMTDVPGLIGVYDTPPYGREGTWPTLEAMVVYAVEFTGGELTKDEMQALISYVKQIPGEALWLNSARPLSGSDHVWVETPLELTFSQLVAPEQLDFFKMTKVDGEEETPLAGAWSVTGRVARFIPEGPLSHDTTYHMHVEGGLMGSLGQVLLDALDLTFTTGGVPGTDVSGQFRATLYASQVAPELINSDPEADIAFLQATGGNVTGVLNTVISVATISHLEGVTSGMTLVLEPFLFDTDFGEIQLESGYIDLVDEDGDGYADGGTGAVSALGFTVPLSMVRTSTPGKD